MRFSGVFQSASFTVRKRSVNAFLPPPYTVSKPSKNAPKRLKKFAMPSAKTRTLCRRLAAPSHQKTALYGHFSASCRFLHPKLQPVGPFLILCAFSHTPHASFSAGPCSKHPSSALAQEGTRGFFCGVPAAQRTAGVMMLFLLYHNAAAFFYCPFWGAKRAYAARPFCPARRAKRKKRRIIIVFLHFRIVRIFSRTRTVVFAVCFVRA